MSKPSIPVIKFLFKENHRVLGEALNIGSGFEMEEFSNSNDLSTYLSTVPAGLVVTSLTDRNDLIQIATFMKLGKKVAKDCAVKVVVFNFSKDRNFEKAIAKLGILDLVDPGINTKALKFKIDFWMKSLNGQIKTAGTSNAQKIKSLEQNKAAEKKPADNNTINWINELELEDDIWLLKHDNDCKKVLSKWLIRLLGPSPYIGQWVEVKSNLWRFDIKESEKELFVPNEGAWFFSGDQKPEFVWKENIWLISGDSFDLFFKNSQESFSRLNCKNKVMTLCKNSLFAKTKEPVIIESFDKELVFKKEADLLEDLEGKNNTDHLNGGNLEGKGDTDQIDGGPLEGKNKTPADKSDALKGKMKGVDAIEHANLEQKTSTSKEKSHWANKNSYEEEEINDNLGVKTEKHRDGKNLEQENSDSEHQKYYKNHNEAKQYEAGELGKGLHGKSSTDELPAHYDNSKKTREASEKQKEDELAGKGETDRLKSHYGQKDKAGSLAESKQKELNGSSATDKIPSHYGKLQKETEPSEKATPEREEQNRKERDEKSKELAPATSERETQLREKNQNSHKESKTERESKEESQRDLKGKSSTEKLDSHYGKRKPHDSDKSEKDSDWQPGSREKEQFAKSRKAEDDDSDEQSQKTQVEKNWEEKHDFGFKSEESRLYANKKPTESDETKEGASILPLSKARDEKAKAKSAEEQSLDKITEDAKIVSLMIQKGRMIECGFDDFFDGNLIFHTDDQSINTSADVNLDLKFKFMGRETILKINGNIETVEDDGEGKNYVTVKLSDENTAAFGKFMRLFEIRQENVNEFLKKAKGL